MKTVLLTLAGCLFLISSGCDQSTLRGLSAREVAQAEIVHPNGGIVITDRKRIGDLIRAMEGAELDDRQYRTAKILTIYFSDAAGNRLYQVQAGGSLFDFRGHQYYDHSNDFERIIRTLLTRKKDGNSEQDAGSNGDSAGAASP